MAKRTKFVTFTANANQGVYTKEGHKAYIQGITKGRPPADLSTWTKAVTATKLLQSDKLVTETAIRRAAGEKVRGRPPGVAKAKRGRPVGSKNKPKVMEAVATA